MKKFLLVLLATVCLNSVYAVLPAETPWTYDLENLTATRTVNADRIEVRSITAIQMDSFGASAARSVNSLKALLPAEAQAGQWYAVKRRAFIEVEGITDEVTLAENYFLQFTETRTTDTHAHYKTGERTASGLNDVVTRYPVYQCTETTTVREVLAKLANAAEDVTPFILATETIVGPHVEGAQIMSEGAPWMPTNPGEQTHGSGFITPDPKGVGEPTGDTRGSAEATAAKLAHEAERIGKQAEDLGKKLGKKLGFRKK